MNYMRFYHIFLLGQMLLAEVYSAPRNDHSISIENELAIDSTVEVPTDSGSLISPSSIHALYRYLEEVREGAQRDSSSLVELLDRLGFSEKDIVNLKSLFEKSKAANEIYGFVLDNGSTPFLNGPKSLSEDLHRVFRKVSREAQTTDSSEVVRQEIISTEKLKKDRAAEVLENVARDKTDAFLKAEGAYTRALDAAKAEIQRSHWFQARFNPWFDVEQETKRKIQSSEFAKAKEVAGIEYQKAIDARDNRYQQEALLKFESARELRETRWPRELVALKKQSTERLAEIQTELLQEISAEKRGKLQLEHQGLRSLLAAIDVIPEDWLRELKRLSNQNPTPHNSAEVDAYLKAHPEIERRAIYELEQILGVPSDILYKIKRNFSLQATFNPDGTLNILGWYPTEKFILRQWAESIALTTKFSGEDYSATVQARPTLPLRPPMTPAESLLRLIGMESSGLARLSLEKLFDKSEVNYGGGATPNYDEMTAVVAVFTFGQSLIADGALVTAKVGLAGGAVGSIFDGATQAAGNIDSFVKGHGWSGYDPQATLEAFGLGFVSGPMFAKNAVIAGRSFAALAGAQGAVDVYHGNYATAAVDFIGAGLALKGSTLASEHRSGKPQRRVAGSREQPNGPRRDLTSRTLTEMTQSGSRAERDPKLARLVDGILEETQADLNSIRTGLKVSLSREPTNIELAEKYALEILARCQRSIGRVRDHIGSEDPEFTKELEIALSLIEKDIAGTLKSFRKKEGGPTLDDLTNLRKKIYGETGELTAYVRQPIGVTRGGRYKQFVSRTRPNDAQLEAANKSVQREHPLSRELERKLKAKRLRENDPSAELSPEETRLVREEHAKRVRELTAKKAQDLADRHQFDEIAGRLGETPERTRQLLDKELDLTQEVRLPPDSPYRKAYEMTEVKNYEGVLDLTTLSQAKSGKTILMQAEENRRLVTVLRELNPDTQYTLVYYFVNGINQEAAAALRKTVPGVRIYGEVYR